jgi:predicted alpha/beta hydrolase family esterase
MEHQPTCLIIPGLRDESPDHWQTLLHSELQAKGVRVQSIAPIGKHQLSCLARIQALDKAVETIEGSIVLIAHSGACMTVAHWVQQGASGARIKGALLAVPPDFEQELPSPYPSLAQLKAHDWLPTPRMKLPFRSIVACSDNDPLAKIERVRELAAQWSAQTVELGSVGHLNPASGFGHWPKATELIEELMQG